MLIWALAALAGTGSSAMAKHAVLVDPHGPLIALGANAFKVPAVDLNLRSMHRLSDRWGLIVRLDTTAARLFFVRTSHSALRIGPRIALRARGLHDWAVHPFAVAGVSSIRTKSAGRMARFAVFGAGVEVDRTWIWRHLVFELGVGAYGTVNTAYTSRADALTDSMPPSVSPVKPTFNGSIGYAW